MADPFAIIGLVDTAFSTCLALYEFFSAVAEAPDDIKHLVRQLGEFKHLFPLIRDYAHGISQAPRSEGHLLAQDALFPMLQCCATDFDTVYAVIKDHSSENLSGWRRLGKKISWVLEKDQIQDLTKRLEIAKTNLSLALQVSGGHTDLWVLEKLGQLHSEQETLRNELQKGFMDFVPQLLKSLGIHENRLGKINTESYVHIEHLSKAMADPFRSFPNGKDATEASESHKASLAETLLGLKLDDDVVSSSFDLSQAAGGQFPDEDKAAAFNHEADADVKSEYGEAATLVQDSPHSSQNLSRTKTFDERNSTELAEALARFQTDWAARRLHGSRADMTELISGTGGFRGISSKLESQLFSGLEVWKKIVPGDSSNALAASFSVLLQIATEMNTYKDMLAGLVELSEAIQLCQREFELQPAPEIGTAMTKLYIAVLDYAREALNLLNPGKKFKIVEFEKTQVAKMVVNIRKQTDIVMREVEYQQRREMRRQGRQMSDMNGVMERMNAKMVTMHDMVRDMQVDQQRILAGISSQRAILESLQDQQNLMSVIKTQQQILRGVEQLLLRLSK